jgi:uncharacterized protein
MASAADNVATLKHVYEEWNASKGKNGRVWLDIMADDVRIHTPAGRMPEIEFVTEDMSTKQDLERYLAGLRDEWDMIYYEADRFVADGDRVAVLCRTAWICRKTGRKFVTRKADFATFAHGKIVEWYEFYDTAALLAALQP